MSEGGWIPVAPSAIPFADNYPEPTELTVAQIRATTESFCRSRASNARSKPDFAWPRFMQPTATSRMSSSPRTAITAPMNTVDYSQTALASVRKPQQRPRSGPPITRSSFVCPAPNGSRAASISRKPSRLPHISKQLGIDLVDCSGNDHQQIPVGPGYQTPFASRIRRETGNRPRSRRRAIRN